MARAPGCVATRWWSIFGRFMSSVASRVAIDSHEPSASLRTVIAVLSRVCASSASVLLMEAKEVALGGGLSGHGASVEGVDLVGVIGENLAAAQLH